MPPLAKRSARVPETPDESPGWPTGVSATLLALSTG